MPPYKYSDVCEALDRAAAQTAAYLIKGYAGADIPESTNWLIQGKRWNALMVHVVSDAAYSKDSRYLRYHISLPWNRTNSNWESNSPEQNRWDFLNGMDKISSLLDNEQDNQVKEMIEPLLDRVAEVEKAEAKGRRRRGQRGNVLTL